MTTPRVPVSPARSITWAVLWTTLTVMSGTSLFIMLMQDGGSLAVARFGAFVAICAGAAIGTIIRVFIQTPKWMKFVRDYTPDQRRDISDYWYAQEDPRPPMWFAIALWAIWLGCIIAIIAFYPVMEWKLAGYTGAGASLIAMLAGAIRMTESAVRRHTARVRYGIAR